MKILIIEDNKKLALGIKRGLEQEPYVADYVLAGAAGERQIELNRDNYDLVILDIMLPEKDDITICRNWRKANITIPVLMLTAKDAVEDKIGGLDCGADDYLTKPFLFDELTA
ncbi:MAG: response regulator [Patescibacteria group bacterium]|nr:response regulator [Patescibacteria group bacterium]